MRYTTSVCHTIVLLGMLAALRTTAAECSCSASKSTDKGFEYWPGMYITTQASFCNGTRPSTCEPAPWAQQDVPICSLGDIEILLPSEPRPPVVLQDPNPDSEFQRHDVWPSRMQRLANIWRNHSCHYIGIQENCIEHNPNSEDYINFGIIGEYTGPARASVLDFGADPTGQQFQFFKQYFDGPLVGWNVLEPHVTTKTTKYVVANDIGNFTLVYGVRDACLPFPDNSFDYVWSINVLEHVTPIRPYLEEIFRVLKPGGIFWGRYNPNWYSARGHHIHMDMVKNWGDDGAFRRNFPECADLPFVEDGTTMPDWAHLYMTEEELQAHLRRTPMGRCEFAVQYLTCWLYHDEMVYGTNKIHYQEVLANLEDMGMARLNLSLQYHQFDRHPPADVMRRIGAKYGHGDVTMNQLDLLYYKPLDAKPLQTHSLSEPPKHSVKTPCWEVAYAKTLARRSAQQSIVSDVPAHVSHASGL